MTPDAPSAVTSARQSRLSRPLALIACISLAMATVTSTSCGEIAFAHVVRVTINDPTGRLGPAPWRLALLDVTRAYDAGIDYALRTAGGETTAGSPFVGHLTTQEARMATDTAAPSVLHLGLVMPALSAAGWFRTQLVVLPDGRCRGYARFSPWGQLAPPIGGEVLLMQGRARPNTNSPDKTGWDIDLTIDIPGTGATK